LQLAGCTTLEAVNRFLREHYIAEFNRRFQVKPEQAGSAFVPCRKADLDDIFCLQWQRAVNRDNTVSFENLHLQIEPMRWRSFLGRLHGDGASTSGWDAESSTVWVATMTAACPIPSPTFQLLQGRAEECPLPLQPHTPKPTPRLP
jgi:hypothetical protein